MADAQSPATSAVEDKPTAAQEATSEAANDVQEAAPATEATDAPSADAATDAAEPTSEDVTNAGPETIAETSALDEGNKTEADSAAATQDSATSSKNKKKPTSGVPEHKSKKLNKKRSMPTLNLDIQPGEHYWARLKGYPPWPSVCCDEQMLPESLLASRPVSTKRPDGQYREDFQDGGKNAKDRTYPMMFLATNEFAWMVNVNLSKLDKDECANKQNDKKLSKDLKRAYEVASEGHDLDYYKKMLQDHEDEMREYAAERDRLDAEKAEKEAKKAERAAEKVDKENKKKSRKSKGGDGDEMDVDETEDKKPASKKRKKEAESEDGDEPKPKKTPKAKLSAKEPGSASAKKPKAKKVVAKPEADGDDESGDAALSEADKLKKRQQTVLYLRHRLQKGFISRTTPPKEDEMTAMAEHFEQLESYKDIEAQVIRETKVHKVLKAILKLDTIPKDEEHNFRKRASALLAAWTPILDGGESKAPTTNGHAKDDKKDEPKTEDKAETENDEAPKEPSEAPVEAAEPGNAAVDEADVTMADTSAVEAKDDKPAEGAADAVKEGAEEAKKDDEAEAEAATETAEA